MNGMAFIMLWTVLFLITAYHDQEWDKLERFSAQFVLLISLIIGIVTSI